MNTETKKRGRCPIDVFRYHDYRTFLSDFYAAKKKKGYSYRAFSMAAGLGAPNYLKLVITGKRNLTTATAERFADACKLGKEAAQYFLVLVQFNQSEEPEQRAIFYQRLSAFQRYRKVHRLELADAAYHSTWYLPAIRELVLSPSFVEDPRWIAAQLTPPIRPVDAEQALDILLQLGLIHRNEEGRMEQRDRVVSTGAETAGVHIRNYHLGMLQRSGQALTELSGEQRDVTALTMCLGPRGFKKAKQRLAELRRELIELSVTESAPSQVLQLNMQLFPLTRVVSSKKP